MGLGIGIGYWDLETNGWEMGFIIEIGIGHYWWQELGLNLGYRMKIICELLFGLFYWLWGC